MKNIFYIIFSGLVVGFLTFTSMINIAQAKTPVPAGTIISGTFDTDVTWTKSASPYILSGDVFINGPHTLTIESGVTISLAPERLNMSTAVYVTDGTIKINGTTNEHVKVGGIDKIHIYNGSADVAYTDMTTNGPGLILYWSHAKIATSTFSNSTGAGLYIWSSDVDIVDSQIKNNANDGVIILKDALGKPPTSLFIKNSIIKNNGRYAIANVSSNTINAENNWWGSPDGPIYSSVSSSTASILSGPISYDPWLIKEPDFSTDISACCSSILFIPGLEASRLYRPESGLLGMGSSINQLWEPNRNDDVRKLFLDSNGSSTDSSIYTGGPIDKALGIVDIYRSFMTYLDGISENGTISEWKSFGYDWRKSIVEVVAGRENRATTTDSLIETVEDLASRSKTKKVTLIAHSNGGLVAKYLVKTLQDLGKENLIDSVISVAVPYLGTPQAILALLHGDSQSIGYGAILKQSVAKELGLNMASAYSLLPSAKYFTKIFSPTITYAGGATSPTTSPIDSSVAQNSFISSRANSILMTAAEIIHGILDPFVWPTNIARWAIVGWGKDTTKGIIYSNKSYNSSLTSFGDGTVVVPSATFNSGTTTAIDLKAESNLERENINHSNILESQATKSAIQNIIGVDSPNRDYKAIENEISKIPNVTIGEPDYSKEDTFLVLSTHSPVDLHVYDQYGNHTGITPTSLELDVEEGLYTMYETKIPGSNFRIYDDENQYETYVTLPDDSGQKYNVNIRGVGVGEFTYQVERIKGGEVLDSAEYSSLPTTPLMIASSTVTSNSSGTAIPVKIASSTSALTIDVDGDGSVDIVANPESTLDPITFLESLKNTVIQLIGTTKLSKDIVRRIDRLEGLVKNGDYKRVIDNTERLKKRIIIQKSGSLSIDQKNQIIELIDIFIAQYE
ncbi:MAG: right-handed parallel beta-helix repeat-containing protein [Patescibacteria group bacterium]